MIRSMLLSTSPYVLQVNWPMAVSLFISHNFDNAIVLNSYEFSYGSFQFARLHTQLELPRRNHDSNGVSNDEVGNASVPGHCIIHWSVDSRDRRWSCRSIGIKISTERVWGFGNGGGS